MTTPTSATSTVSTSLQSPPPIGCDSPSEDCRGSSRRKNFFRPGARPTASGRSVAFTGTPSPRMKFSARQSGSQAMTCSKCVAIHRVHSPELAPISRATRHGPSMDRAIKSAKNASSIMPSR